MAATATALDFTYKYAYPSEVGELDDGFGLQLATCGAKHEQPYFFHGTLRSPREMGEMLLVLSDVVRTHFFLPRPPMTDPVVTGSESMLLTASPLLVDAVGVEWRENDVALTATSRLPAGASLPVSGWNEVLDSANLTVNLPPGYQLLAAPGADNADSSWIARWRLGDVFLLCLGGLMAWRLGGAVLAVFSVGFLLLSFDHRDAPMLSVLALLLVLLLARWAQGYRIGVWLRRLAYLFAFALAWVALPYAAGQLSLALHPQLERSSVDSSGGFNRATSQVISRSEYGGLNRHRGNRPYQEDLAPAAPAASMEDAELTSVTVTGASIADGAGKRVKGGYEYLQANQALNRIDPKAVVQAGGAEPQWRWHSHQLSVSGPIAVDQRVSLLMTPPWLTRSWRVLSVLLLGLVLLATLRRLAPASLNARLPAWALVALCLSAPAAAADYPSAALLEQLRTRLSEPPECAPQCALLAQVQIDVRGSTLAIELEVHSGTEVSVPLPSAPGWQPARVEVDGSSHQWLWLEGTDPWISLPAGVRRVRLQGVIAGDQLRLRFPMNPGRIVAASDGWLVSGIQRERLPSGALELNRQVRSAQSEELRRESDLPAYVRVTRSIAIDLDWTVITRVERVAPADGVINVAVPLLSGERLLAEDPPVREGAAQISLAPGRQSVEYVGRIEPSTTLQLTAPPLQQRLEIWQLAVSPIFHAVYDGPVALLVRGSGSAAPLYHPLPGDQLSVTVSRPQAQAGTTLAIDGVGLATTLGSRLRESTLSISLRATRGGQHALQLPADAELLSLSIDGRDLRVRPEQGRLLLPITPGEHTVELKLRETQGMALIGRLPTVDLGLPAANVGLRMNLPEDRWLLAAGGPQVGPAVRYWSILALVLAIALALGRIPNSPLRTRDWLLLGIGLSTVAWPALIVVAAWLYLLQWRQRRGAELNPWPFAFTQLGLIGFSGVVLLMLVATAWSGLLGDPKMTVQGNGSTASKLIWFADHSDGALPGGWALSLPLWVYKAAILAWSLWLANALIAWLRRAFEALGAGGWWKTLYRPSKKAEPAAVVDDDDALQQAAAQAADQVPVGQQRTD